MGPCQLAIVKVVVVVIEETEERAATEMVVTVMSEGETTAAIEMAIIHGGIAAKMFAGEVTASEASAVSAAPAVAMSKGRCCCGN